MLHNIRKEPFTSSPFTLADFVSNFVSIVATSIDNSTKKCQDLKFDSEFVKL